MIPGAFTYHRPSSVAEAVSLSTSLGDSARFVAGGHSLIPMMKLRMAVPEHLIDLQDLTDLRQISIDADTITIGAMVTQAELINSQELFAACPIIRETSLQIADPQVRNVGTLGGNVANGDPGNDMPALMQALGASYILQSENGSRELAARDFYEALFATALAEGELLTTIRFPRPAAGHGYCYMKQKRKIGDYATAAAAVMLTMKDGRCSAAAIALTNVGDTPLYAQAAVDALVNTTVDAAAIEATVKAAKNITNPADDGRGPADFRIHIAGVMVRRAIEMSLARTA